MATRETNLKFSFKIEIYKKQTKWEWNIYNHKNKQVGKSDKAFESKEECQDNLKLLSTSIEEFLSSIK